MKAVGSRLYREELNWCVYSVQYHVYCGGGGDEFSDRHGINTIYTRVAAVLLWCILLYMDL